MVSQGSLSGIKVIDLSRVLAGPYCTMMLGDLGAEVVKIEAPHVGDDTRRWGPPWQGGESAYFLSVNRNKYSVTIDLKQPAGQRLVRALAEKADVVIENFRHGKMKQWGLDYETLSKSNEKLVYCSISGYGRTGPNAEVPGYDFAIQAESGLMSITGPVDAQPHKVGVAIVDVTTGLYASSAILAALLHVQKTGQGQLIDISLFDSALAWLVNVGQNYLTSGSIPQSYGNKHANIVPYQCFETADKVISLAIGNDKQYETLCKVIEASFLWDDLRFQTNPGRVAHREELVEKLQSILLQKEADDWLKLFRGAGLPCAPVQNIKEALQSEQVEAREMLHSIEHPLAGHLQLISSPIKLSKTPTSTSKPPPTLGEHSEVILREWLGYTDQEIDALRAEGTFG